MSTIAENLRGIENRIAAAAERSGRKAEEIRLVAVSKTVSAGLLQEAVTAGVREVGENYVQEAADKFTTIGELPATRHLIGHLQRNKAAKAAALFDVIQTLDRLELARDLDRRALALGRRLEVLVEVNISREARKAGVSPEQALELASQVAALPGLRLRGLMGIGPLVQPPGAGDAAAGSRTGDSAAAEAARRSFQLLRQLFEQLPTEHRQVLSMGMTGDFELAIAEGSTMVRIGTGIFGERRST